MNQQERISKRNAIENELQYKLDNVIEKIKSNGIKDTGLAQRIYDNEVKRVLRAATQKAYQLAIDYVTSKIKTDGFPTHRDLDIVKEQVEKYSMRFWRKVDMILHRNDVLLQTRNYEPRSELNSNYMATVVAVAVVTTTLAKATQHKAIVLQGKSKSKSGAVSSQTKKCPKGQHWDEKKKKCVQDDDLVAPVITPFPEEETETTNPLDDVLNVAPGVLGLASLMFTNIEDDEFGFEPVSRFVLVWNAILDNKTCATCEEGDGSEWSPDDPNLPVLGDEGDIHDNCRCWWDVEEVFI